MNIKFAQRLKEIRTERGLRQKDVAAAIGVTLQAICNYEAGTRDPSLDILCKLCDFFEVSADYLLGRADY